MGVVTGLRHWAGARRGREEVPPRVKDVGSRTVGGGGGSCLTPLPCSELGVIDHRWPVPTSEERGEREGRGEEKDEESEGQRDSRVYE